MVDVCLLGTGGMMPLPGRALTSLYVRHQGRVLLIDCGEGTQTAIRSAALRFKPMEAILITHFHADHISGLPGLLLTLGNEGRTEPLEMIGPEGLERVVNALRIIVPDLPFEIHFREIRRRETVTFACAGMTVTAFPAEHGMHCLGYKMELERPGKFDPAKAREKQVPLEFWGRLQKGESVGGYRPEDVLGPARQGLKLLYATDTRPVPAIVQHGKHADLLVLEGMFCDPEKQARAEESHHMTMQEAAALAREAEAKELWLTHFSPANPEPQESQEALTELFPMGQMGTDGMKKTLRFPE